MSKTHVYIVGSKGIPAKYGGFETFVEKLTEYQTDKTIQYHIACMEENSRKSGITEDEFIYNGAECFNVSVPQIGPARAIYYDIKALKYAINKAKQNNDNKPVFYVLACRIGPFIGKLKEEIKAINGRLYVNPDGHEWLREKWSKPVRRYWKVSEKMMVKYADLLICDSKNIEHYIKEEYKEYSPETTYIAYGTDLENSKYTRDTSEVKKWFAAKEISEQNYYLVVGRFVPENNYETMIREFMKSSSTKDFVLITNVEHNKFYEKLKKETNFDKDSRIKFVGTVYNQELLKYIREQAFAYIHGHEVGGTNPSLLEALASTPMNLLLDVGFNREVGQDGALYWRKNKLTTLIYEVESMSNECKLQFDIVSTNIVADNFNWDIIDSQYEQVFMRNKL